MQKIIKKLNLSRNDYFNYNDLFLKINENIESFNKDGKLIVVTSINPTPHGEGKTSLLIGLVDAMNYNNKNCIGCLRQPSLGPIFGLKGPASGGGKSRLANDDMINLHFTGDFHAITTANNLISTIIENEIFLNSKLNIDPTKILWKRCEDLNDRSLRNIDININDQVKYKSGFNITAASDLMMLFCLAKDKLDFKHQLENTIVAFSYDNNPIKIKDLEISDAILEILKQALKVNVAKTLYGNCVFIHGGPFANIAHGCNSIIATNQALKAAEYVISECGFGSDLGFEKFMNIKMQSMHKFPNLVVIACTIKALIHHGTKTVKSDPLLQMKEGFKNLLAHVNHVRQYGLEPLVILNIFSDDSNDLIQEFAIKAETNGLKYNFSNIYNQGPELNTTSLVRQIVELANIKNNPKYLYDVNKDSLMTKLEAIVYQAYGLNKINLNPEVEKLLNNPNFQDFYVCIAKTPYSLSSNQEDINIPENKIIDITDYEINYAAKTIVLICNKVFRMPGLNKEPRAKKFKW